MGFSDFIQPIEPLQPEQPGFDFGPDLQAGLQVVNQGVKDRRRHTRGMALEGLAKALVAFTSNDPAKQAAQFIEQSIRMRQRQSEVENNDRRIRERYLREDKIRKTERAEHVTDVAGERTYRTTEREAGQVYGTGERVAGEGFRAGQQTERIDASKEAAVLTRGHQTSERKASQGFQLKRDEEQFLQQRGMAGLQYRFSKMLQDDRIDAQADAAIQAELREIQQMYVSHAMALGGDNELDNMAGGLEVAHFLSGAIPRSELSAESEAVMSSMMEKEALRSQLQTGADYANLIGTVVDLATTPGPGGMGTVFNKARFDELLPKVIGPELAAEYSESPALQAGVRLKQLVDQADGGKVELTSAEYDEIATYTRVMGGGDGAVEQALTAVGAPSDMIESQTGTDPIYQQSADPEKVFESPQNLVNRAKAEEIGREDARRLNKMAADGLIAEGTKKVVNGETMIWTGHAWEHEGLIQMKQTYHRNIDRNYQAARDVVTWFRETRESRNTP